MKEYLEKLMARQALGEREAAEAFERIMSGQATPAQVAGFIVALRMKGETADEIAGAAGAMRRHAVFVDPGGLPVVDTCGTGGDGSGTFNISTAAAFITAGAGVPVAKHGNRAISSRCGSADVLAELGVNIEASTDVVEECIRDAGFGFLFAPRLHPAMKHAMGPRKELGVRTVFNMLGPLTNPSGALCQVLGVFAPELTELFANVLKLLGARHALIVHGHDGMDELTTTTASRISELRDGRVRTYDFDPAELVGEAASLADLQGGAPEVNAGIIRGILGGDQSPCRDIACLNAGAAIFVGGKARSLAEGWTLACDAASSGAAARVLEKVVEITTRG